jgi:hypothetical protein
VATELLGDEEPREMRRRDVSVGIGSKRARPSAGAIATFSPLISLVCWASSFSTLSAVEPDVVRIRVSVKQVLSSTGALPRGRWRDPAEIAATIDKSNAALAASGSHWELDLVEVVTTSAAPDLYVLDVSLEELERRAKASRTAFRWRSDAINIYLVDEITYAGGVCSFPTFGSHRETIAINGAGILGGSEGWLHEIGHWFNLIHTHEGDLVEDTVDDTSLPNPFDCQRHDSNFVATARGRGDSEIDIARLVRNVMSYHCDPRSLTPQQLVRMQRALVDYRRHVLIPPEIDPPTARLALRDPDSFEVSDSIALAGDAARLILDASASRDGAGGRHFLCDWELVSGTPGGALLDATVTGWEPVTSSIGYSDDDDWTELADMEGAYLTIYLVTDFELARPEDIAELELDVTIDDGFAASLSGVEIARSNLSPTATRTTPALTSRSQREILDVSAFRGALRPGKNRLAVEVHNQSITSSDLSFHAALTGFTAQGSRRALVLPRATWFLRKGNRGDPPDNWTLPEFDPSSATIGVEFTEPGEYTFSVSVDQGRSELDPTRPASVRLATAELTVQVVSDGRFVRGDCNRDAGLDLSDPIRVLLHLFGAGPPLTCPEACDANDDARIDLSDAVGLLSFLFRDGPPPAPPYPTAGLDIDEDSLDCTR